MNKISASTLLFNLSFYFKISEDLASDHMLPYAYEGIQYTIFDLFHLLDPYDNELIQMIRQCFYE